MAPKKTYDSRRSPKTTRGTASKRRPRARMTSLSNRPFATKRFVGSKVSVIGTGATQVGALTFALSDVNNPTDITNLFNRFRIAGIQYRWVVQLDPMIATTKTYPRITWAHDYEDTLAPTTLSLTEYPNMKEFYGSDNRQTSPWYFFKPAYLTVAYETALASAYRPTWKGMIDTESAGTPFYGLKYAVENLQTGVNLTLQCRYWIVAGAPR